MSYNVGIIGAGLIGRKRAASLNKFDDSRLIVTADINKNKAESLTKEFGGEVESDWHQVIKRNDIDIVIVATFNKFLAPICIASLKNGKHSHLLRSQSSEKTGGPDLLQTKVFSLYGKDRDRSSCSLFW